MYVVKIQLKFLLLLLCWGYKHVSCRHPYATRSLPPLLSSYLSLSVCQLKQLWAASMACSFSKATRLDLVMGFCSRISFAVVVAVVCSLLLLLLLCPHD